MNLLDLHFYSEVLGMQTRVRVALPVRVKGDWAQDMKLTTQEDMGVLYLLHGMGNGYMAWEQWTCIERYADGHNLALVMPEAYLGWYTDCKYGFKWYTYLTKELPEKLRNTFKHFTVKREETFIAGISMGGYGALKCALKESGFFGAAGVFAAGIAIDKIIKDETNTAPEIKCMEDIFGTAEEFKGSENDLFAEAERRKNDPVKTRMFFGCGTRDRFYEENCLMRDKLLEGGWELRWNEGDADHDFGYWDSLLPDFIRWLDEGRN